MDQSQYSEDLSQRNQAIGQDPQTAIKTVAETSSQGIQNTGDTWAGTTNWQGQELRNKAVLGARYIGAAAWSLLSLVWEPTRQAG